MKKVWKLFYLLFRDCGLCSLPFIRKVRNLVYQKHLNAKRINVDKGVRIQQLHLNRGARLSIGDDLHVGRDCLIDLSGSVTIGDRVTVSDGAKIFTHSHPIDDTAQDWRQSGVTFSELCIGDDAWIGANAIILSTVTEIGPGSVIGAGSVVRKDVAAHSIVAGTPAKHIRVRRIK